MLITTYPYDPTSNIETPTSNQTPPTIRKTPSDPRPWGVDAPLCPECSEELVHQTHHGNADYYACLACGHVE